MQSGNFLCFLQFFYKYLSVIYQRFVQLFNFNGFDLDVTNEIDNLLATPIVPVTINNTFKYLLFLARAVIGSFKIGTM